MLEERTRTLFYRITAFILSSGRADDNLEVIKRRFYSYEHETKEVLDKLKEQVSLVN